MKKIAIVLCFALLVAALASCGSADRSDAYSLELNDSVLKLKNENNEIVYDLAEVEYLSYSSSGSGRDTYTCEDRKLMEALLGAMFDAPVSMEMLGDTADAALDAYSRLLTEREMAYSFVFEDGSSLQWLIGLDGTLALVDSDSVYVSSPEAIDYDLISPHLTWLVVTRRDANGDRYDVSADGKTFLYYYPTNTSETFTVPDGIETVVDGAFAHISCLKELSFAPSVKTIGYLFSRDFRVESLEKLTIPATVTCYENTTFEFHGVGLKELVIECSIGGLHVGGCDNLETIVLKNVPKVFDGLMFDGCAKLRSITVIGQEIVRDEAFEQYCASQNGYPVFYIPDGVEKIGYQQICSDVNLYLPDSVQSIDMYAYCPYGETVIVSMAKHTVIESVEGGDTMYSVSEVLRRD